MIDYSFFYTIAEYGNENWKGSFSPREVACNAYNYLCEFNSSKEDETPTEVIKTLYSLLIEDETEECLDWAYTIATELNLIDMDYLDYMDTDKEIILKFVEVVK